MEREAVLQAFVRSVERLGAETHLHLAAYGHPFVMRCFGEREDKVGQALSVLLEMPKAHFFDASSGKRIRPPKCQPLSE
jgi:ABC-type sugar transport system ATPase subunit